MLPDRSRLRLIIAALLLTPAVLIWILGDTSRTIHQPAVQLISGVDYFMKTATVRDFDSQGTLHQSLTVAELNHFPASQHADLTAPSYQSTSPKGAHIQLHSKSGRLFDQDDRLELHTNVVLTHQESTNLPEKLTTDSLTLLKNAKIVETQSVVTLTSSYGTTQAAGIKVNYATELTELLSNVRGTYHAAP